MSTLPSKAKVVIIGGGIHGLSTAWKLSETYKNPGDIVVLEKKDIAAGASGIACGVVRNNYFQPAMRELMAHSVSVWESDPKAFKYNAVGYLQISPEVMHEDVATIYEQQKAIGYDSEFIEGEKDCTNYMKNMFDDWLSVCFDVENYRAKFKNDFAVDVVIQQLNEKNIPVYGIRLEKAFPTTVAAINLDNNSTDTVQKLNVTFSYENYVPEGPLSSTASAIRSAVSGII